MSLYVLWLFAGNMCICVCVCVKISTKKEEHLRLGPEDLSDTLPYDWIIVSRQ